MSAMEVVETNISSLIKDQLNEESFVCCTKSHALNL